MKGNNARQMHTPKVASDFQRKKLSCLGLDSIFRFVVYVCMFIVVCTCMCAYVSVYSPERTVVAMAI